MTVHIIGAGMAGLLAGRMLQDMDPLIYERQPELPNNHRAVLRFRTEAVSLATNIPFRKVRVLKAVVGTSPKPNPIADAVGYAMKVTGKVQPRSIIDTAPVDRFIAPPDLISRLAAGLRINYGFDIDGSQVITGDAPIISTIPMPALMDLLDYPHRGGMQMEATPGWTLNVKLPQELGADLFATIYNPWLGEWYRASITGDRIAVEAVGEPPDCKVGQIVQSYGADVLQAFGLLPSRLPYSAPHWTEWNWTLTPTRYQKIATPRPEDREAAKRFIMWATAEHGIYSLGRFATWRPGVLLDDVVNDVRVIRRLIEGGSAYDAVKRG